uniref:Beta-D-glucosyl crocetin beta-1,6-glucosyltransferase-like n=1 Tax=Nicotiana tabacum TaxID=4097 RepID=A0A1S4CMI1_TOBAC|nr:PREDICTED: beta-D-glucosyl crocetin beta-1,6-glucosyltransferase-like [Nicotiana tabacum]
MINDADDVELIDWLEKKDENSTLFVNFGSEYFLTKEDMEERAFGLKISNVNFIWVVRFSKGEEQNLEEALPQGFLERIGERGKVLQKWGPKSRILNHTSIGGFISYCDWSSIIKCLDFGVPIIAMPIHLDQPMNARLMVELEIVRDDDSKIHREEILQVLESVISGKIGENLSTKVRDISKNLKSIRGEEIDATAEKLIQLSISWQFAASFKAVTWLILLDLRIVYELVQLRFWWYFNGGFLMVLSWSFMEKEEGWWLKVIFGGEGI